MRSALHSAIAMTLGQSTFAAGNHAKGKVAFAAKCGICHETGLGFHHRRNRGHDG